MNRVRVMYWKEIPVQVQAEDANGRVSRQLENRFQQAADTVAMQDGSQGTDEYLDGWGFGPYEDGEGTATDAAEALNLDGGGSSVMVVHGRRMSRPSDEDGERAVRNALAVVSDPAFCRAAP